VTVETRLKPTELQLARNPCLNSTQKKREEGNRRPDGDLAAYGRHSTGAAHPSYPQHPKTQNPCCMLEKERGRGGGQQF